MHAHLTSRTAAEVQHELSARGVDVTRNPDVLCSTYGELSVDDARAIAQYASLKAVAGAKYLILAFDRIGVEAQNALLKVVEEAPGGSHFYLCTPHPGALIPTLRSRCIVETLSSTRVPDEREDVATFLSSGYADRLSRVEKMVTALQRTQDRSEVRAFVRALVRAQPCRTTLDAARYLEQHGSSPKLVLSHLAVVLPQV